MPIMKNWNGYEIYDEVARTKVDELETNKADVDHTHSAGDVVDGVIPVEHGGTGGSTVAAARNNLGLGNTSGALPIANGGTNATTSAQALNNLGITWGTAEAPATSTPNTIYIQIN